MFCPQCGTQTNDTDAYCPSCGADMRSSTPQPAPAPPSSPQYAATPQPAAQAPGQYRPVAFAGTYPKASLGARLLAVIIDSIVASALLSPAILVVYAALLKAENPVVGWAFLGLGSLWYVLYTLGRDGFGGAGVGKRMCGLVVVSSASGSPASMGASIYRQFILFALNLIPAIGSLVEPIMVISDKDGRRLGDKAAKTQAARTGDVISAGRMTQRGKGGAIIAFVLALLILIGGSAIGGVVFARSLDTFMGEPYESGDTLPPDDGTDATPTVSTPEGTVDAFYLAVAQDDYDAVLATFSEELVYYADPEMFATWSVPEYRLLGTTDIDARTVNVDVQEYDGETSLGVITYIVVLEPDGWKIDDWDSGDVQDDTTSNSSTTGALNAETATDAVGSMLWALLNDDVDEMRTYSTAYFQETYDSFFYPSGGAFIDFEITDVYQDVDTWIVVVTEDWNSGPEQVTYIVRDENGTALVDDMLYE